MSLAACPDSLGRLASRHTARSERQVVVGGEAATRRGLLEVGGLGWNVALQRGATIALGGPPGPQELHSFGDDRERLPLARAVLRLPLAPLEAAVDRTGRPYAGRWRSSPPGRPRP